MEIMVSVYCLAYNHEKYIRKTLEGFVTQKTNFKYEVIIHDDASTDKTTDIIKEFAGNYPELIIPIYQTENQYSKKVPISKTFIHPLCRGKYIAICEGDDYWCDSTKLQMQVDYMEAHPKCSMCVHDTLLINEDGSSRESTINGSKKDIDYHAGKVIRAGGGAFFQTSSFLAKAEIIKNRPDLFTIKGIGDYPMCIYAAVNGYVHYIGKVMSCYRIGGENSWSKKMKENKKMMTDHYLRYYESLTRIDKGTRHKYWLSFAIPRGKGLYLAYRYGIAKEKYPFKMKYLIFITLYCIYITIYKWMYGRKELS